MSTLLALLNFREPINAWSHCLGLVFSVPATWLLWKRCEGGRARRLSLLVFGLSLSICYAGSTLYHAVRLSADWIDRFDRLDHIGIFLLIAGTYTPVAWNLLDGPFKWGTLSTVWLVSALGTACLLMRGISSIFWATSFYMILGWASTICYVEMARVLRHRTLFPLLFGGILYTLGAVINLAQWPSFWPGVFGAHEIFHLFVMAGSFAHFCFMLEVIASPSSRPATPELEALSDRCPSNGYSQPLVVHASPDWERE